VFILTNRARATFLIQINNPLADVLIYLVWIALWCGLIWLLARFAASGQPAVETE